MIRDYGTPASDLNPRFLFHLLPLRQSCYLQDSHKNPTIKLNVSTIKIKFTKYLTNVLSKICVWATFVAIIKCTWHRGHRFASGMNCLLGYSNLFKMAFNERIPSSCAHAARWYFLTSFSKRDGLYFLVPGNCPYNLFCPVEYDGSYIQDWAPRGLAASAFADNEFQLPGKSLGNSNGEIVWRERSQRGWTSCFHCSFNYHGARHQPSL